MYIYSLHIYSFIILYIYAYNVNIDIFFNKKFNILYLKYFF